MTIRSDSSPCTIAVASIVEMPIALLPTRGCLGMLVNTIVEVPIVRAVPACLFLFFFPSIHQAPTAECDFPIRLLAMAELVQQQLLEQIALLT